MSVLLIEDDETIGEAVRSHLMAEGHDVVWSKSLTEGRAVLAGRNVDVIVLDLQLPDGCGQDLIGEIRGAGMVTPLIVVSSLNVLRRRLDCLRAGADDYLVKPFHLRELGLRIHRLAGNRPGDAVRPPAAQAERFPCADPPRSKPGAWARMRDFLRVRRLLLAVPLVAAAVTGGYLVYLQISGNFHTVIEGELYRSAQPTQRQLERYIADHGIRTVVNLRGVSSQDWYRREIETTARLNVRHIDFGMSSNEELTAERADEIVALLKDAPKPILIHCKAGADRTGLVSVIYTSRIAGMPEASAERQLSVYYGHVSLPYVSRAFAMDESWEKLERHYGLVASADPDDSGREKS